MKSLHEIQSMFLILCSHCALFALSISIAVSVSEMLTPVSMVMTDRALTNTNYFNSLLLYSTVIFGFSHHIFTYIVK